MTIRSRYLGGIPRYYDSDTIEEVAALAPVTFYDDFLPNTAGATLATSLTNGTPWIKKEVKTAGTPTVAGNSGGSKANGTFTGALDATSEKQEASLYNGDVRNFVLGQGLIYEALVKIGTLPTGNAKIVLGLNGAWADDPDTVANSCYFKLAGSGVVNCRVFDNSVETVATDVTLTNAAFHLFRIDFTDLTDIRFYIDGNRAAGATTFSFGGNAAAQLMQAYFSAYKASGTGVGGYEVDFVRLSQKRS